MVQGGVLSAWSLATGNINMGVGGDITSDLVLPVWGDNVGDFLSVRNTNTHSTMSTEKNRERERDRER